METIQREIKIYVACLAAYNNGQLHGAWIDAHQSEEEIKANIKAMLAASPIPDAEEYAIHDYEGFGRYQVYEFLGIAEVARVAAFIAEHGEIGAALLDQFMVFEEARTAMEDHYAGCFASVAAFAEEIINEAENIPDRLARYIDYDAISRDMIMDGVLAIELLGNETHVFWSH